MGVCLLSPSHTLKTLKPEAPPSLGFTPDAYFHFTLPIRKIIFRDTETKALLSNGVEVLSSSAFLPAVFYMAPQAREWSSLFLGFGRSTEPSGLATAFFTSPECWSLTWFLKVQAPLGRLAIGKSPKGCLPVGCLSTRGGDDASLFPFSVGPQAALLLSCHHPSPTGALQEGAPLSLASCPQTLNKLGSIFELIQDNLMLARAGKQSEEIAGKS